MTGYKNILILNVFIAAIFLVMTICACTDDVLSSSYFPEDFVWGGVINGYNAGGSLSQSDYDFYLQENSLPANDYPGYGFYVNYDKYFRFLKSMGGNGVIITLDWSALEPEKESFDSLAFAFYETILESAIENELKVTAMLFSQINPFWFTQEGGWINDDAAGYFENYARECAEKFGQYVDTWITFDDPVLYSWNAYMSGMLPSDINQFNYLGFYESIKNQLAAHFYARNGILEADTINSVSGSESPEIGINKFYIPVLNYNIDEIDVNINTELVHNLFNVGILDILISGTYNEVLSPLDAALANFDFTDSIDFVGLKYLGKIKLKYNSSYYPFFFELCIGSQCYPDEESVSCTGIKSYPEGLYHAVKNIRALYNIPVLITENGFAANSSNEDNNDEDNYEQAKYIASNIKWLLKAINDFGINEYYYYSLTDQYEPYFGSECNYGLIDANPDTENPVLRESADVYRQIILMRKISDTVKDRYDIE